MHTQTRTKETRISPRKVRLVADAVKNMSVQEALSVLLLSKKRGAHILADTLKSAIANAMQEKTEEKKLFIKRIEVNEGPFLKRFHASTRGRIHPYKKRSSNIKIMLEVKNGK